MEMGAIQMRGGGSNQVRSRAGGVKRPDFGFVFENRTGWVLTECVWGMDIERKSQG